MSRSAVLASILLAGIAVALLIGRMGEPRAAPRLAATETRERASEPAVTALDTPAPAAESATEEERAKSASAGRRVVPRDDRSTIAGRVVVPCGIPADEKLTLTAEIYSGPINRRGNSRPLSVPLAADGAFAFAVPAGARYALLDLDARFLHLPESVKALPGESGLVLRPEVSALIEGRVLPPLGVTHRPEDAASEGVRVSYGTGIPLESAFGQELLDTVVPRADGSFAFAFVPTGVELELRVKSPYVTCKQRVEPLAPGEKRHVVLALDPGITVSGRVVDEHGGPVEGVGVTMATDRVFVGSARVHFWPGAKTETDAHGGFTLNGLARERLKISASDVRLARGAEVIVDGRTGDARDLLLTVERGGCVEGTVEWPDGRPAERVFVSVGGAQAHMDPSSGGGRFRACALAAGTYELEVCASEGDIEGRARASGVRPGGPALRLVLDAERMYSLAGTVVDLAGSPVSDFQLELASWGPVPVQRSRTGKNGGFNEDGLRAGEWTVRIEAPGMQAAEQVVLVGPEITEVRFALRTAGRIHGRVLDEHGRPVAGARVGEEGVRAHHPVREEAGDGLTDDGGEFEIAASSFPFRIQAACAGHASSEVVELAVAGGDTLSGVILRLRPACRIEGRVVDEDGQPVAGALVWLRAADSLAGIEVDVRGEFVLDDLPPGTGQVSASRPHSADHTTAEVTLASGRTSTLELRFASSDPR